MKTALESALASQMQVIKEAALRRSLASQSLDVTLPGRPRLRGRLHPDTQILRELYRIFAEMGFQVYRSREIETDENNFQLLNFPVGHPARDMQDTYFIDAPDRGDNPLVLRTHTSPGQIRAMREISALNPNDPPPVRVIVPGMVYRYEQTDTRHETQFDQLEGLAVGPGITFSDLKGTLTDMARRLFGPQARTRFRASYFPFTEPSAEFDIQCFKCKGAVQSVLVAGGGTRGGTVIGASDRLGAFPAADPQSPENLAATIYNHLGIPATAAWHDALDRPHHVYYGDPIRELWG